jgi:D-alanyl-D-alanine carboxypeptidase (penicillin-binding protein 5/6)
MSIVQKTYAQVHWKDSNEILHSAKLKTTNSLLGIYPGVQGLKTGTTTEAGQCLISYVTRTDGNLLLVLLGSKQRYRDSVILSDEGWAMQRSAAALRNLANDPQSLISSPGIF